MSTTSSGLGISYHQVPEFSVSRAWRDGWRIFRESPVLFVAIVLAGDLPGGWGGGWLIRKIPVGLSVPTKVFLIVVPLFCLFFLFAIAQGLISLAVYHRYNQQPDSLRVDWQGVMSRALPLCVTMLCVIVLGTVGVVALIIPGLIVLTVYAVAVPICVVESEGPGASLTRSAELTRGNRWPIFGLMMTFVIVCVLLDALVAEVWSGVFGLSQASLGLALLQGAVTLIPSAYFAVTCAIIYCHLREIESSNSIIGSKVLSEA